ncbi:unnamed protein product [Withania somnifera]
MVLILTAVSTVTSVTLAVLKIVQTCQEIHSEGNAISSTFSNKLIVDIDEPEICDAVDIYLNGKNEWKFGITKPEKDKNFKIINKTIDFYEGHKFKWEKNSKEKTFKLTFHKKIKDLVLQDYLLQIVKEAELGMEKEMQLLKYIMLIVCFLIIITLMIVIVKI